jgi:hypothetical protein
MLGTVELPLLDQGSVQFMLMVLMLIVVCALLYFTIAK